MKSIKNVGSLTSEVVLSNGSRIKLCSGSEIQNVDVSDVPKNLKVCFDLTEVKRTNNKNILND
jgi:hypothetical protein